MVKIKSITDVITNSSSETFLIKALGYSRKKLLKELENLKDNGCSGMGGMLEVFDSTTISDDRYYTKDPDYPSLPDDFFVVDIDWSKKKIINHLLKKFIVLDVSCNITTDENGRVISLGGSQEGGDLLEICGDNEFEKELFDYLEKEGVDKFLEKYWYNADKWFQESYDWDGENYIKSVREWKIKFDKLQKELNDAKNKEYK